MLGDTAVAGAAPFSECSSVVFTDHGLFALHAAGFAGCPPGTEPGGNWVQGREYASNLNQPHTSHFAPHSSLLMTPTRHTETGIQPLFCSHTLPCFAATLFTPSLHYAPSCRLAAAHMIRASTQPPVLPRPQHPIDPSSQALYSATQ